jgi:hypothetical protein
MIASDKQVVLLDCIEFNPALRWIDVMKPLSEPLRSQRDPLQALDGLVLWSVVGLVSMFRLTQGFCSPSS